MTATPTSSTPALVAAPASPPSTGPAPASVAAWTTEASRRLRAAGMDAAGLDARLLMAAACRLSQAALIAEPARPVSEAEAARLHAYIDRRLEGEPVSRILGRRGFWGMDFEISPDTLDPRPDTETVVATALAIARREGWTGGRDGRALRVLDVGTGSGCILLSLLAELPGALGTGADVSPAALAVARRNAARLRLAGRARFIEASWFAGVGGPFDLVVSNPPYIASDDIAGLDRDVRDFDPRLALDGGSDGLGAYRLLADAVSQVLPDGWLVLEIGAGQALAVADLLRTRELIVADSTGLPLRDLAGHHRCVAVRTRISDVPKKNDGN